MAVLFIIVVLVAAAMLLVQATIGPECLPAQQQEQLVWDPQCPGLPG